MVCEIYQPGHVDKKNIILKEIKTNNAYDLTPEAMDYIIANESDNNINKLLITLDKLSVYAHVDNIKLFSKLEVEKYISTHKNQIKSHMGVISVISNYFNVDSEELLSPSKLKTLVQPRNVCMYFLYTKFNLTLVNIGKIFSNRSHSSVLSAINKVKKLIKNNPAVMKQIDELSHSL
jgi:chromosomal replication initiator protein